MNNFPRLPFGRFLSDRSGNFAMMFAATMVALLISGGIALDLSRAVKSQATSRNALDAAILATARQLSLGNIRTDEAHDFLVNYLEGTLGVTIGSGTEYYLANFSVDKDKEKISADLTRKLPLTLTALAGTSTKKITASSAALYGIPETEIVMTFDVTGSMRGSKIVDLKNAAAIGINELLDGAGSTDNRLRIAMVPYAEGVNAGPLYTTVFAESESTSGPPPADTDPTAAAAAAAADNCSTERKGPGQFTDDNPRKGKINRDFRLNSCPASPLVPLTAKKATLQNAVKAMTVGGGTGGHIGIQWAWYLISPKWADYVHKDSVAAAYGSDVRKFAIIMTDGEFNVAYEGVPKNKSQYRQAAKSMKKARKLCKNMKARGIEIFTIGFALNQRSAKNLLKDCSSPNTAEMTYYHEASTGGQLTQIYKDIATSIKQLRLVR